MKSIRQKIDLWMVRRDWTVRHPLIYTFFDWVLSPSPIGFKHWLDYALSPNNDGKRDRFKIKRNKPVFGKLWGFEIGPLCIWYEMKTLSFAVGPTRIMFDWSNGFSIAKDTIVYLGYDEETDKNS